MLFRSVQPRECSALPDKPLQLSVRVTDPCVGDLRKQACDGKPCTSDEYNEVTVRLNATWQANPWFYCYRHWVYGTLGLLLLLVIVYGFVRPKRFHPQAALRIATKQTELKRASLRPLRTCVGGRHGFYRSAVVSINDGGITVRANQPHVVQLRPGDGSRIDLLVRGQLERFERGGFKPVRSEHGGLTLEANCCYRVNGSVYFEVLY